MSDRSTPRTRPQPTIGAALDGDLLGDDPVASYRQSADAAAAALEAPGALDAACAVSYGPVPGSVYAGHRIIDVFIHGWDLAVATGQDTRLAPDLVAACTQIVEPQLDYLRASGAFGHAIQVPADADAQPRLLTWLGRHQPEPRSSAIASPPPHRSRSPRQVATS